MTPALPLLHFPGRRVVLSSLPPAASEGLAVLFAERAVGVVRVGTAADGRVRVEFPRGYGLGDGIRHFYVPGECLAPAPPPA